MRDAVFADGYFWEIRIRDHDSYAVTRCATVPFDASQLHFVVDGRVMRANGWHRLPSSEWAPKAFALLVPAHRSYPTADERSMVAGNMRDAVTDPYAAGRASVISQLRDMSHVALHVETCPRCGHPAHEINVASLARFLADVLEGKAHTIK